MNISRIAHAMEYIDDELITDSISYRRSSKKMFWTTFAAVAACAVITLTIAKILPFTSTVTQSESAEQPNSTAKPEIKYIEKFFDWMPYDSVERLISDSDTVVVGKVTDISFMVHDDMTDPQPESKYAKYDKVLCTVYDLEVSNVYKGKPGSNIKLKIGGGLEDEAYADKQLAVLENVSGSVAIMQQICPAEPTFEISQEYLLVLREFEDFAGFYYPVGYYQGVYRIDPALDVSEDQGKFSIKNVISYFGEEQWAAFKSENYIKAE